MVAVVDVNERNASFRDCLVNDDIVFVCDNMSLK